MSTIEIRKISITDLNTDAVVNAANEGLWAGNGVCGAIFAAAGHDKLQKACDAIGHCDTGSAVITPGFNLKAKYIIHAVGPRWKDGKHGEQEQLYGAYYKSLELAAENNCRSIGFPLISAGIFGYPLEEAWQVAIRACRNFIAAGNQIDIVFAILNDNIIKVGQKALAAEDSHHSKIAKNDSTGEIIGFHLPDEPYGYFSNWFPAEFTYAGVRYNCVEQYMMAQKVHYGGRYDLYEKIMQSRDPQTIKNYAGKESFPEFAPIKDFWDRNCRYIVKRGVKAKFAQNPELLQKLLDTQNALLAECAGHDRIWGIGINLHDSSWHDVSNWRGSNYLGIILMEIRAELRNELREKNSVEYTDFRDAEPIPEWKMTAMQLKRIPQYYAAIHAYADQLPVGHIRDSFYKCSFEGVEEMMRENMGGGLPIAGFYEMKQDIFEIAQKLWIEGIWRESN